MDGKHSSDEPYPLIEACGWIDAKMRKQAEFVERITGKTIRHVADSIAEQKSITAMGKAAHNARRKIDGLELIIDDGGYDFQSVTLSLYDALYQLDKAKLREQPRRRHPRPLASKAIPLSVRPAKAKKQAR